MHERLQDIIDPFAAADDEMRLELLLDFAKKLPPLPERFHDQRVAGLNKVPECMTPVFMWLELEDGCVRIYVDVAEEAPTVKGLISILIHAYDGASPAQLAQIPNDLLNQLGLSNQIRMQRAVGFSGIVGRIRRQASELMAKTITSDGRH
jgi:cysteine desulfuration protein SufE